MHVSLLCLLGDAVDGLGFAEKSQCGDGEDLSLSSLEEAGSVCPRQYAVVDPQRSDLVQFTVVRTDALIEDHAADLLLGDLIQHVADILGIVRIDLLEVFLGFLLDSIHVIQTLHLINGLDRGSHLVHRIVPDRRIDVFGNLVQFDVHLRLADFRYDLLDELNDLLDLFVGEHDGVQHFVLGNDLSAGFDHHDGFLGAGDGHVHGGLLSLLQGRVDDELAVHSADSDGTRRTIPRECRRSPGRRRNRSWPRSRTGQS